MANVFGHGLVDGDRVAESAAARMRSGRKETNVCRMATIDVGMRHAAEDREVVAQRSQSLEVGRRDVVSPSAFGKEVFR